MDRGFESADIAGGILMKIGSALDSGDLFAGEFVF